MAAGRRGPAAPGGAAVLTKVALAIQIALHGRGNIGGLLGTAVSHGCVRLADDVISRLAARIGPGVPVTIF